RLATQVQKHADQVFYIFSAQAEVDRTLLASLNLEADCITVGCNVADDVYDKRHSASSLCVLRAQSLLRFSVRHQRRVMEFVSLGLSRFDLQCLDLEIFSHAAARTRDRSPGLRSAWPMRNPSTRRRLAVC